MLLTQFPPFVAVVAMIRKGSIPRGTGHGDGIEGPTLDAPGILKHSLYGRLCLGRKGPKDGAIVRVLVLYAACLTLAGTQN